MLIACRAGPPHRLMILFIYSHETKRTSSNLCPSKGPNASKGATKYALSYVGMQAVLLLHEIKNCKGI